MRKLIRDKYALKIQVTGTKEEVLFIENKVCTTFNFFNDCPLYTTKRGNYTKYIKLKNQADTGKNKEEKTLRVYRDNGIILGGTKNEIAKILKFLSTFLEINHFRIVDIKDNFWINEYSFSIKEKTTGLERPE